MSFGQVKCPFYLTSSITEDRNVNKMIKRTKSVRGHAKAFRKTDEPKRSGSDPALEYAPNQTAAEGLSPKRSGRFGVKTSWAQGDQSFSRIGEETSLEFDEDQI
jgi:hypothetical protein